MGKNTLCLETVKEAFCIADKKGALEDLRTLLDSQWDFDTAAQMAARIGEDLDEQIKQTGLEMSSAERISWAVKEAYIIGHLEATYLCLKAADQCFQTLSEEIAEK